jgi:hypothetical protein
MSQEIPVQPQAPTPGRPSVPLPPQSRIPPVEPVEVLGRHKNTGQKDHKGAR